MLILSRALGNGLVTYPCLIHFTILCACVHLCMPLCVRVCLCVFVFLCSCLMVEAVEYSTNSDNQLLLTMAYQ